MVKVADVRGCEGDRWRGATERYGGERRRASDMAWVGIVVCIGQSMAHPANHSHLQAIKHGRYDIVWTILLAIGGLQKFVSYVVTQQDSFMLTSNLYFSCHTMST